MAYEIVLQSPEAAARRPRCFALDLHLLVSQLVDVIVVQIQRRSVIVVQMQIVFLQPEAAGRPAASVA